MTDTSNSGYRISAATGTHIGNRPYQQDQVAILTHPRTLGCLLGVVADGMGGRSGGRKAADQVILSAQQLFEGFSPHSDDPLMMLNQLVQDAHLVIKLTAITSEQEPHSTLAAFLILPNGRSYWVHSGDSRIYHFHRNKLVFRTLDHSYVQQLVDKGEITEEDAKNHPKSNLLMGCLGMANQPPSNSHELEQMRVGDCLMACTDGIWHYFDNQELGAILSNLSPREASAFLIKKAQERAEGRGDNLSLAILKIEAIR